MCLFVLNAARSSEGSLMRSSTLRIWWDATEVSFVLLSRTWGGPNIASGSPCFVLSSCGAGIAAGVPREYRCVLVRVSRTTHVLPATLSAADDEFATMFVLRSCSAYEPLSESRFGCIGQPTELIQQRRSRGVEHGAGAAAHGARLAPRTSKRSPVHSLACHLRSVLKRIGEPSELF